MALVEHGDDETAASLRPLNHPFSTGLPTFIIVTSATSHIFLPLDTFCCYNSHILLNFHRRLPLRPENRLPFFFFLGGADYM